MRDRTPNEGIVVGAPRLVSPISWWVDQEPQAFTQRAWQELPRMALSKFARTPPQKMIDGHD